MCDEGRREVGTREEDRRRDGKEEKSKMESDCLRRQGYNYNNDQLKVIKS